LSSLEGSTKSGSLARINGVGRIVEGKKIPKQVLMEKCENVDDEDDGITHQFNDLEMT